MQITLPERLRSRKLWVTVIVSALVAFTDQLGFTIPPEKLKLLVELAFGYLIGQGGVDIAKAIYAKPILEVAPPETKKAA